MSDYKVVDNFLKKNELKEIKNIYDNINFPWYYADRVAHIDDKKTEIFYLMHLLYQNDKPNSGFFDVIIKPFLRNKFWNSLIRVKLNFFPNQNKFVEHISHKDNNYKHKGALFCLNTCNGYTKMYDGKKIDSVENRMIFFDPSKEHSSTNTTDKNKRVNINFNYF